MPTISVILPNYNHAEYLEQRIESVLRQTYQDFELILMDDKSSDDSKSIISKYAQHEKVTHVVLNEINSGSTFKQWKKGIALAQGKYIWLAESDDYADANLLETLIKPFQENHDLVLSYCQSAIVDENGKFLHLSAWADPLDSKKWKQNYLVDTNSELKNYLYYRNTIPNASGVLFLKPDNLDILDEAGKYKMAGDWVFWRYLLSKPGKIAFNSKPLNYFRLHQQTTRSSTTKEKELTRLKELKGLIVPSAASLFNDKYDWVILSWWYYRKLLKGSKEYFMPDLPPKILARIPWFLIKRVISKYK